MTTREIADRLAAYCREGKFEEAQKELYHEQVVSLEPVATPVFEKETRGKSQVAAKIRKFLDGVETVHSIEVSQPLVATFSFACTMRMDVTMKAQGRMNMQELCVYQVKDGKIIQEAFYM